MPLMNWAEEAYFERDANGEPLTAEDYEKQSGRKGGLKLSRFEVKMLLIAGTGFFMDSYDLFIINLATPVWQYEYWGGNYPAMLHGVVNAGANIGNVFGQLLFGLLGDALGRRFVYGKELILCMIGIILIISLPNSIPSPTLKMIWIFCWRIFMGIGIGGDYPMSASIVAERGHLHSRGSLLGWVFSGQGWGTLLGSVCTIIILACFEPALNGRGEYSQLDAVWRIQIGLALVPALIVLPFRLTMPEGKKYLESQKLNNNKVDEPVDTPESSGKTQSANWKAFFVYFSEWRHFKILLGTALSWFLVDIAFYGTNLNQSVILSEIGFSHGSNIYHTLMRNAIGNLIVSVAGYLPGYFFTIFFIERLGRRWIQIQGFLVCALLFGCLAGDWNGMNTAGRFVCFALAQFFFNFGPNATTFIIPAEVFPSRVRGAAHGFSAACGKLGAILSALLFNWLSSSVIGLPNVLWIFFGCNILGAVVTFFLIPETKGRDADLIDAEESQALRST
ncbi:Major facilitator superfamily domain, general substrate transporter [Penicillium expansum]|uniref:Major facilitator superfamily domain, general substrate transporter n=1 Tax=Penicillium expansum TaxID=27334 RepID=A0A0A2IMK6_PENEN|nr:Major facilitator superfamily domain, general substrate transporter [Penicillium expansum]KGO44294.1 Major facilitator superfamily domain, general substrate transporter [Penicillium expansum]KGO55605.1 Major facilitator superfamily domain, general substrate transporter [Penicillium expansum]KGO70124.1 Major facilitator superfamily domain, general substrate transporter [Penicillium expansum]